MSSLENSTSNSEINSGADILGLLKGKQINKLSLKERKIVAQLLSKQNFGDTLDVPDIPSPNSPQYEFLEQIQIANVVYSTNKKADQEWMTAMVSENPAEFQPALAHLDLLNAQVNQYQGEIDFAAAYLKEPKNAEILQIVRNKYVQADSQLPPGTSMIDRVANRLSWFTGLQFSSDLDMTMTENTLYLKLLAHARQFENFMELNGRETLPFVMARYAKEALVQFGPLYEKIGRTVPLRPGVKEFFKLTHDLGIPVSILSANFRDIVSGCLEQIPAGIRSHLLDVTGLQTTSILASRKDITTAKRILFNPDFANFLCLDGLSDKYCLEGSAQGTSAAIFVLSGTEFAQHVKNSGEPYFEFNDFHQINQTLLQILDRKKQFK